MKNFGYLKSKEGQTDLKCIMFLLLAGCLFLSGSWQYVYWMFFPRQPVLLEIDLENSTMSRLEEKGNSYTVRLHFGSGEKYKDFEQITTWYANAQDAKQIWKNPQDGIGVLSAEVFLLDLDIASFFNGTYEKTLPPDIAISSSLRCYNHKKNIYFPDDSRVCMYLGYYEHWFTQIWFQEEQNLMSDAEMFALIKKAACIIRAAPPPDSWNFPLFSGYIFC
jgi:hypothetical protein